ncbi:MAG: response regulator [Anaerolineae bacterium]|nr:response regulator [Anaerolineae bacterium]
MTTTKVLYIDDDFQNGTLMKRVLEADGYDVSLAANGVSGLTQASSERHDLILLDVNMPDLSGYEVARSLRQMYNTRHIPILLISATFNSKEEYLQVGCDGFISKPIDVDHISEQIAAYL